MRITIPKNRLTSGIFVSILLGTAKRYDDGLGVRQQVQFQAQS